MDMLRRLFWLILTPLCFIYIIFGTIMLLPYWITTGADYYESKYFKRPMDWFWKQYPNNKKITLNL